MTARTRRSYNEVVALPRLRSWGTAAAVVLGFVLLAFTGGAAAADPSLYGVSNSVVVNINVNGGSTTIKTWDRQAVQTESNVPVDVKQFAPKAVARALNREIPVLASSIVTPQHGQLTLPEETFVLSSVGDGPHDAVVLKSEGDTVITIPQNAALVVARGHGIVTLQGYRTGTFFIRLQGGSVRLQDDGGEGFVQVMRGGVFAADSSFNRLRVRTAQGGMLFERCHARQIQATSVAGSVVYDNGSFEPGLARFETQYGHVAIGVSGAAQIGAHSDSGHIFTNFERRANVDARQNDASASIGGGGALVTASAGGAVLLYDGSVTTRTAANLNPVWRTVREAFVRIHTRATGSVPEAGRRPTDTSPGTFRAPAPRAHVRRGRPPRGF